MTLVEEVKREKGIVLQEIMRVVNDFSGDCQLSTAWKMCIAREALVYAAVGLAHVLGSKAKFDYLVAKAWADLGYAGEKSNRD